MRKYDGTEERALTPAEIKQIAGRAGRGQQPGVCTTLDPEDLPILHAGLASQPQEHTAAAILPPFHMLETYASQHPGVRHVVAAPAFGRLQPGLSCLPASRSRMVGVGCPRAWLRSGGPASEQLM